jgi:MerR family transcriptional regulator, thiopeptide resistance regulator
MVDGTVRAGQRYTVGEVARLAGVTVRTLHHYGDIGLLEPSDRTGAGYRQYSAADLDRLARILYYRDLGFPLDAIGTLLDEAARDGLDTVEHLRRQHQLLTDRLQRVQAMVQAIEKEMEAAMSGNELSAEEKLEIFGESYDPAYEQEAEQRWGDTDAWKQSQERTKKFSKGDWQQVKDDMDAFNTRLVEVYRSGAKPGSPEANEVAEAHRASIEQFYDCSYEMQRKLADMYLADERFTKNYEDLAPGLAQWIHDAIHANADQQG